MKSLIVYDSFFSNTEKIAQAIGKNLAGSTIVKVQEIDVSQLSDIDMLIVGSPTRGFRPTPDIKNFIKNLPNNKLKGIKIASFDTRMPMDEKVPGFLKLMAKAFGYAAEPIAKSLQQKGGTLVGEPTGFYVQGKEGPLSEGESDRASNWSAELTKSL